MKKISIGLLLLKITCTFSFHKMSNGDFFKKTQEISQEKLTDDFDAIYSYDKKLGYYLFKSSFDPESSELLLRLFKQQLFDPQWWENNFELVYSSYAIKSLFYISSDKPAPVTMEQLICNMVEDMDRWDIAKYLDEKNKLEPTEREIQKMKCIFGPRDPAHSKRVFYSDSKVQVINDKSRVTLSLHNQESNEIDFQDALLKYMRSRKHQQDQQFKYTPNFICDFKNPKLTEKNELKMDSISKIANASKTNYTQDQITLLKNSKILTIWNLPLKIFNNKNYVEDWNKRHPEAPKEVEFKAMNSIVMGFAYDKRDNMTYNWIIDLSEDISILFDYAEELKSAKK